MEDMIARIARYRREVHEARSDLFDRLSSGQEPEALFVTCSDSRVVPALVMQADPGELFVIRNAGNLVPGASSPVGGEIATLEYAVAALKVRHIVVCGHSDCGAMKGLLAPASVAALPHVAEWLGPLGHVREAVLRDKEHAAPEAQLRHAIELNVLEQLSNLRTHPMVREREERGELALHGWVYDIGSGTVSAYDGAGFEPLVDDEANAA